MSDETIILSEIVRDTGVPLEVVREWVRKKMLPTPVPQVYRARGYVLPRAETLALLPPLVKAWEQLQEAKKILSGK